MKRMMIISILLSSTLIAATIKPTGMVTDTVSILSNSERMDIENLLQTYKQRTTNEIAVLIVKSLDNQDIKQYANTIFHDWGIGIKGQNNGILFLWSTGDRKMRFEVGYGLEGALPDGRAGQIIREDITPQFRSSKWFDGLKNGLTAVIRQIDLQSVAHPAPTPITHAEQIPSSSTNNSTLLLIVLVLGVVSPISFAIFLIVYKTRKDDTEEIDPEMSIRSRSERIVYPNPVTPKQYYSRASTRKQEKSSYSPPVTYVAPTYESPSYSSSSDSSSSSSSSSDFGGFSGGDSGGGGADGSY